MVTPLIQDISAIQNIADAPEEESLESIIDVLYFSEKNGELQNIRAIMDKPQS